MDLSEAQRAACLAVVRAPEAWSRWDEVEAVHGAEVLAGLAAAGVVEPWARTDYTGLTLTPWGAWLLGVEIDEVWRKGTEDRGDDGDDTPFLHAVVREAVLVETPVWREEGKPKRPLVLPRHARIGRTLAQPERVEARPDGGDVWRDEEGEPVKLLGREVRIDRRLG